MAFAVYDQPPGLPPVRHSAHATHAAAEVRAFELVREHLAARWRVVEQLRDAGRWRRWVLRRGAEWAAVEVREEGEP